MLHTKAKRHVVKNFKGPLSIKTVSKGQVTWIVKDRPLCMYPNTLLILNDGEHYSMNINEEEPVETRCVFFRVSPPLAGCFITILESLLPQLVKISKIG